jgi:rhodanese-related sulfurtransferase
MHRGTGGTIELRPLEPYELRRMLELGDPVTVLDVRSVDDYPASDAEIHGALRLVPEELEQHLRDLPRGRQLVTYGADDRDGQGERVAMELMRRGYTEVRPVRGGFEAYLAAGGPVSPRSQNR